MDFWSQKQGCRLPFVTSRTPPKKHKKNQNGTKSTRINMVRVVTTRSGTRKTPTNKEIKNPQSKKTNSDNDTTSNNSPNNPKDTSIKEMQSTDPFCRCIVKRLLNKTAPEHELKTFFIHNGLLYRYASVHSKDLCPSDPQSLEIHDTSRNS